MLRILLSIIMVISISGTELFAGEQTAKPIQNAFSVREENDAIGGQDENYTNGISMALTQQRKGLLGGLWGDAEGKRFATYELTQLMFTPSDIRVSDPPPDDHPYAGLLYLGFTTHLMREDSLHSFKLITGLVGPGAFAEDTQRFVHRIEGYSKPQGWSHQLKNEPVINLVYEYRHKYRFTPPDAALGIELIPMAGAFLGNYLVQAETDLQFRIGYHLPDDYGSTVLRGISYLPFPQEDKVHYTWGAYAYAGGGANLVGWNLVLDGNTLAKSHNVNKRLFLPAGEVGGSFWTRRFQATLSYVMWGKEYTTQKTREDYISGIVSLFF